jgi:hypothetical protein
MQEENFSGVTVMGSSALNQVTPPLRLNYPVYTLDKQLLLPENTVISTKTVDTLISSNSQTSYKTYSLFEYGSVKKDIFDSLQEHHYPIIFAEQEKTNTICKF